jgi:hypothetical protein
MKIVLLSLLIFMTGCEKCATNIDYCVTKDGRPGFIYMRFSKEFSKCMPCVGAYTRLEKEACQRGGWKK